MPRVTTPRFIRLRSAWYILRRSLFRSEAMGQVLFETTTAARASDVWESNMSVPNSKETRSPFGFSMSAFGSRCERDNISLDRKAGAALLSPAHQYAPSAGRSHANQKTVCFCSLPFFWLVGLFGGHIKILTGYAVSTRIPQLTNMYTGFSQVCGRCPVGIMSLHATG